MKEITMEKLPFYWRLAQKNEKPNNPVKGAYPFRFGYDSINNLVIQKRDAEVLQALNIVYTQDSNVGYLQDNNEIAKQYGTDFIEYLDRFIENVENVKNIFEIGSGGCVVLDHLKKRGKNVKGIDSSSSAAVEGKKKKIDVITDFFPSTKVTDKFDLIYHVDVLEHINDPIAFLKHHHNNLHEGGFVIVNVPDATESIEIGDISMALHQHLNYFTKKSLRITMQNAGFEVLAIDNAGYGGSIYGVGRRSGNIKSDIKFDESNMDSEYSDFLIKSNHIINNFDKIIGAWLSQVGASVGYYVPLRVLPYLSATGIKGNFRFFDDTKNWHRREFDGIDIEIENFSDLKTKPVTHMLVMSLTFGGVIKKKLVNEFGSTMEVMTLSELAGMP